MQFIWPLDDYIITRDFYYLASLYVGGQHAAIDLIRRTGATRAAPIRAVADGTVVGVGWDYYSGFFVGIDHAGDFRSSYRHLYGQTPVVVGQRVSQGQIVGNVGSTGGVSLGDHLHFDLWNRNKIRDDDAIFYKNGWYAVDPMKYLGQEDDDMNEEQWKLLQDTHHHVHILIPQLIMTLEINNRARYAQLRKDIAATGTGGGLSVTQVKAAFKAAIRELVKAG